MSMDLTNEQGAELGINAGAWGFLLNLAEEYGWTSPGTDPPDEHEGDWDGSYDSNDGQRIRSDDATALAVAFRAAAEDPDRATVQARVAERVAKHLQAVMRREYGHEISPQEAGVERRVEASFLLKLAAFCEGGWVRLD